MLLVPDVQHHESEGHRSKTICHILEATGSSATEMVSVAGCCDVNAGHSSCSCLLKSHHYKCFHPVSHSSTYMKVCSSNSISNPWPDNCSNLNEIIKARPNPMETEYTERTESPIQWCVAGAPSFPFGLCCAHGSCISSAFPAWFPNVWSWTGKTALVSHPIPGQSRNCFCILT